jgi:hypothetical protein
VFTVPQNKDLKRLVRARMAETGENYAQALSHEVGEAVPVTATVALLPEEPANPGLHARRPRRRARQ